MDRNQRDFDDLLLDDAARATVPVDTFSRPVEMSTPGSRAAAEAPAPSASSAGPAESAAAAAVAADDGIPRGTRLDDWFGRLLSTPQRQRAWAWGLPIAVVLLAAILRLWNLGHPHVLVFDETFYVKDAWTLWNLGFEGEWPKDPDAAFAGGDVFSYTGNPSFIAHPPFGKWLIALGIEAFGVDNSFSWRFSTAVAGILGVLVIILVAKKLFRSTLIASLAGFLFAIDGHAITLSRVTLLDNFLMILTILGVGAILLDRDWASARLRERLERSAAGGVDAAREASVWGPVLWWRPWLLVAGMLFGLAAGTKWTGLYFLAVYGLYVVVVDMLLRRRLGITLWASAAILRQGIASFLVLVPVALAAYLSTWSGWLLTSGGWARNWASEDPANAWTGALAWVPNWAQNLWHYHVQMYNYSIGLRAEHPYETSPLQWLFMIKPTSMYYVSSTEGVNGCTVANCSEAITSIANPLIWYAGVAALFYLLYRLVRHHEWQSGFVLLGIAAGYLPWLLYLDRTVFQFYGVVYEPYMVLALALTLKIALGSRTDPRPRRRLGIGIVAAFVVLAVAISVFFYPLWTGMQVPYSFWQAHMWLPSWV